MDDRDNVSPGWKFNEWELKGVPVRLEIGPRDIQNGVASYMRRDTLEKGTLPIDDLPQALKALLDDIQAGMFAIASDFTQAHTKLVFTYDELREQVQGGYAKAMWCGERACEDKIKDDTGATSRNMPFDQTPHADTCVYCAKPAEKVMYFSKAY